MRIVVLDPGSSEPTWGLAEEAVVLDVPDGATSAEVAELVHARTFGPDDIPTFPIYTREGY